MQRKEKTLVYLFFYQKLMIYYPVHPMDTKTDIFPSNIDNPITHKPVNIPIFVRYYICKQNPKTTDEF